MIPPKVSASDYRGMVKGRSAIRVFNKFKELKQRPYWGNHFWTEGYCVDTVGLDSEMIRKYVEYQETRERRQEQRSLFKTLQRGDNSRFLVPFGGKANSPTFRG